MPRIEGFDYEARWDKANIPVRFRGLGFNDYEPNGHNSSRLALKTARQFVDEFENHYVSRKRRLAGDYPRKREDIGRGLMLWGRNGTRKTTLAAAIATEVQWRSISYSVFMIRFSDYKEALTHTYEKEDSERKERAKEILRKVRTCTLLVLDDVGQEHRTTSGFTEKELHELLRKRVEAGLPTVMTTNVEPEDMYGVYGASFDSFRKEAFEDVMISGRDTRNDYEL